MKTNRKTGILLVNLGTPDSPQTSDVRRYLDEFLMDSRVIDIPALFRTLLVKGFIVPFRGPKSAGIYQKIWLDEGSPLLVYSRRTQELLQQRLGETYQVELSMRYQHPSIETGLLKLKQSGVDNIKVIALFPQYASATTGSVYEKVMEIVGKWQNIPAISFVNSFYDHPLFIKAFSEKGAEHGPENYDHVLFSFHGLPERQLRKADESGCHCLYSGDCCLQISEVNQDCYRAQCHATARLIAEQLQLEASQFTISFQSRLGRAPWAQPYTADMIKEIAQAGKKKVLVLCPAFVADCIETVYEIGEEYRDEFVAAGGETLDLVESLNDSATWIDLLQELCTSPAWRNFKSLIRTLTG